MEPAAQTLHTRPASPFSRWVTGHHRAGIVVRVSHTSGHPFLIGTDGFGGCGPWRLLDEKTHFRDRGSLVCG